MYPYTKVAGILDAEPDKLLLIDQEDLNLKQTEKFVSWRIKNKSNEFWPQHNISQVLQNKSKEVAVSDKNFKLFVTLKEPTDLSAEVCSFYCEPLGP